MSKKQLKEIEGLRFEIQKLNKDIYDSKWKQNEEDLKTVKEILQKHGKIEFEFKLELEKGAVFICKSKNPSN